MQNSFGESFDDDEHTAPTDRLLQYHHNEQSDDDDDDHITLATITNSSQPHTQHQQEQSHQPTNNQRGAPAVLPVSTDGVFANISAKPETESSKLDETPPVNIN